MPKCGEFILITNTKGKQLLRRIEDQKDIHTQDGIIKVSDIIKSSYGSEIYTTLGVPFRIQRPNIYDFIRNVKRKTQVMYPKDISYLCMRLGIGPGKRIIEAGTGSGSLTMALSCFLGPTGHVYTFEAREEFYILAQNNLSWAGLGSNVTMYCQDIAEGFGDITDVDALFLDVRSPWEYLKFIPEVIHSGATIGFFLPTTDQVSRLVLELESGPFANIDICEIFIRHWKPVVDRLRPEDRMIAHTGFLIFACHQERSPVWETYRVLGTRERKQEAARQKRNK